ncbi:MAG: nucleotidyltransferase domain-containing protein [Propionibacterium sp.]|nr:nucleotidyltransferase domain-containing protein [Propionibacterium sp.]MDN6794269.1 nucleotidyltransferase domain-containing protein [Propionibacterium sp.]
MITPVTPALGQALLDLDPPRPFQDGRWVPGPGRAYRRTIQQKVTDHLLEVWERATVGLDIGPVSLAIVGSFARGEGGPTSDIDVVVLHDLPHKLLGRVEDLVQHVLYPLWDSGVAVDHSVRTPEQCREVARTDLAALTGLLDLHHVAGSAELTDSVRSLVGADLRRAAPTRVDELLSGARERWAHEGELDLVNEPDLKSCKGGLRDLNLMRALAATWLTDYPHASVEDAAGILCDVQDALQRVSRRHTAKLLRAHQAEVARALGLDGSDAETDLMRVVSQAGAAVSGATDAVIQRALGAREAWGPGGLRRRIFTPRAPRGQRKTAHLDELGFGIAVSDSSLVFTEADSARDPSAVLELAGASGRTGLLPSAATLDDIRTAVGDGLMSGERMWTSRRAHLFVDFIGSGRGVVPAWFALDGAGLPSAWIPEWEALRSRPQRAEFHRWTVDRHCVGAVAEMGEMLGGRADWLPPFDRSLIDRTTALLVALLHDIGKRPPGGGVDHPHEGAVLIPAILDRMGFPELVAPVSSLVENHLVLAQAATSRDPGDPATIDLVLAAADHDPQRLATLIALTRADSVAAGDKAWNPWRASLVNGLARACWEELVR